MKQEFRKSQATRMRIEDSKVAALLADPDRVSYLAPFVGRERTLSEAAAELEVKPTKLLYRIQQLIEHGLIKVIRVENRGGRPSKIYRSTHDEFFLPFSTSSASTLEIFVHRWSDPWHSHFVRALARTLQEHTPGWGVRLARADDGSLIVEPSTAAGQDIDWNTPDAPVVRFGWNPDIWLDYDDAKSLQRDLVALAAQYAGRGGRQRFLVRLAMVPLVKESLPLDN